MGGEDDKKVGFQIGAFFEENYKLFVIIGVFGALSIYLEKLFKDYNMSFLQVGIVACFILFIQVSLVILYRALKTQDNEPIPLSLIMLSKGNVERVSFIISFTIVIEAIFYFIFVAFIEEHLNVLMGMIYALMGMILYVLGMMSFFGFLNLITMKAKNKGLAILIGSLFLAVISTMGYYYMEKYSLIPFMLFFSSLATGSVIGLLITPIAYFYEKRRTK